LIISSLFIYFNFKISAKIQKNFEFVKGFMKKCSSNMFSFSFVWVPRCDNGESFLWIFLTNLLTIREILCFCNKYLKIKIMLPIKNNSEIVLYQPENSISIEVLMENDTVWLTLDNLSELYQRNKSTISRHLRNIYDEGELDRDSTVANFATVQTEGGRTVQRLI